MADKELLKAHTIVENGDGHHINELIAQNINALRKAIVYTERNESARRMHNRSFPDNSRPSIKDSKDDYMITPLYYQGNNIDMYMEEFNVYDKVEEFVDNEFRSNIDIKNKILICVKMHITHFLHEKNTQLMTNHQKFNPLFGYIREFMIIRSLENENIVWVYYRSNTCENIRKSINLY